MHCVALVQEGCIRERGEACLAPYKSALHPYAGTAIVGDTSGG